MFKLCTSNTTCRPRSVCLPGVLRLSTPFFQCAVYVEAASIGETKTNCTRARGFVDRSTPDFLLPQVQRQHFIPPKVRIALFIADLHHFRLPDAR